MSGPNVPGLCRWVFVLWCASQAPKAWGADVISNRLGWIVSVDGEADCKAPLAVSIKLTSRTALSPTSSATAALSPANRSDLDYVIQQITKATLNAPNHETPLLTHVFMVKA